MIEQIINISDTGLCYFAQQKPRFVTHSETLSNFYSVTNCGICDVQKLSDLIATIRSLTGEIISCYNF